MEAMSGMPGEVRYGYGLLHVEQYQVRSGDENCFRANTCNNYNVGNHFVQLVDELSNNVQLHCVDALEREW